MIETYNDVTFIVKFLVAEKIFEKTLDCGSIDNNKSTNTDLFQKKMAALAKTIFLQNYICQAWGNWTQAGKQAAESDGEIKQDLFNKNLDNLIKHMSIQDDDNK